MDWRLGGLAGRSTSFQLHPRLVLENLALRFKKLRGYDHIWSVRVNEQCRAVGERHGNTMTCVRVGTHDEFDNLFG
jgi:hypothetical protein